MGLFKSKKEKELKKLLTDTAKKEIEIEKDFHKRYNNKYTTENLKAVKHMMLHNAITIDTEEYEEIVRKLKATTKNEIPDTEPVLKK